MSLIFSEKIVHVKLFAVFVQFSEKKMRSRWWWCGWRWNTREFIFFAFLFPPHYCGIIELKHSKDYCCFASTCWKLMTLIIVVLPWFSCYSVAIFSYLVQPAALHWILQQVTAASTETKNVFQIKKYETSSKLFRHAFGNVGKEKIKICPLWNCGRQFVWFSGNRICL